MPPRAARLDPYASAVIVETLTVTDPGVVREAQHWTTTKRGPVVDEPTALAAADLTAFATEAIVIGARALAATAQSTETRAVEQMLRDVGERTADASRQAADLTGRAVRDASENVARVAAETTKAITEADRRHREEVTGAVGNAKQELTTEMRRLFGGENPELVERMKPLLEQFGTTVEKTMRASAGELLEKATKQLDPADPTSPLARHTAALTAQHQSLAQQVEKHHGELAAKVDDLVTSLKVQEARTSLARVTPIKGGSFEDRLHVLLHGVANGLGGEYTDTTRTVGHLARSKKGDGVLTAGDACVVVEMTDSARTGWNDYFDEAERNRGAAAALGVVRTPEQNGGQVVRVLGARRVVLAFDPETDDPELLRTAVLLLRTVALAAAVRSGGAEIATAEERIADAVTQLEKLDAIKKLAGGIQKSGAKIETECTALATAIKRLLDEALSALGGAGTTAPAAVEVA